MSSSESFQNNFDHQVKGLSRTEDIILKPCHICGRTFNPQSLERHEKVCERTKKYIRRNVFNSFSQRAKEIGAVPISSEAKEEEKRKCKKWKEEHENILHVVRGGKNVMNNGLSPQKKVPSGYEQCPSCNRCFNQKAAERHIAWCMEQQTRLPKTPPDSEALKRLKARVKYKAPLPKKRELNDSNIRLVKSAEAVREPSVLRTHSSPPKPVHDLRHSKQNFESFTPSPKPVHDLRHSKQNFENCAAISKSSQKKKDNDKSNCSDSNIHHEQNSNACPEVTSQNKKAVKFKEIFPVYKKDRNKNLDMLAALRLQLSELGSSDDLLDDCFLKSNENEFLGSHSKKCNFSSTSRDIWTSDGEVHCSTSSSSEGSLPSLSHSGSAEPRMPRFCYNCGTKYPIVSAKFCCECGARRFVIGANNNEIYAS